MSTDAMEPLLGEMKRTPLQQYVIDIQNELYVKRFAVEELPADRRTPELEKQIEILNAELDRVGKTLETERARLVDLTGRYQKSLVADGDNNAGLHRLDADIRVSEARIQAFETQQADKEGRRRALVAERSQIATARAKQAEDNRVAEQLNALKDEAAELIPRWIETTKRLREICQDPIFRPTPGSITNVDANQRIVARDAVRVGCRFAIERLWGSLQINYGPIIAAFERFLEGS